MAVERVPARKGFRPGCGWGPGPVSPIYVRDSGLLHSLLEVATVRDLEHHPKVGASWEGYAIEEIIKAMKPDAAHYWATHAGAELDLLLFCRGRRVGIECKRSDAPRLTTSMRIALNDLKLDELKVVYPGERAYKLGPRVEVVPLRAVLGGK
jgi:predicted AAA+ superfamily ATPase